MPRPADLTGDRLAALEAEARLQTEGIAIPFLLSRDLVELYMAGGWLGEELDARGADDRARHNACFGNGQVTAALAAAGHVLPWEVARAVLSAWEGGKTLVPGPMLAVQLAIYSTVWRAGRLPDVDALVAALAERRAK